MERVGKRRPAAAGLGAGQHAGPPRRPPRAGTRVPPDQRHHRTARRDRRDVSRRDARTRPGHQRRVRSQLHPADAPRRTRRRDRVPDAELHAGRRASRAASARRCIRGACARPGPGRDRALGAGPRRAARRSSPAGHARSCCAIPTTRPARGSTGATLDDDLPRSPARVGAWVDRRRDLSRRGAGRRTTRRRCGGATSARSSPAACRRPTGCPGLRIGWVVAPPDARQPTCGPIHDYTTIAPGGINDRLARIALEPARRATLLARTRGIIRANYPLVRRWIERQDGLSHIAPEAGRDRLRPAHAPGAIVGAHRAAARRTQRAGRSGRLLRHGRLPPHRVRIGSGSTSESALTLIGEFLAPLGVHAG